MYTNTPNTSMCIAMLAPPHPLFLILFLTHTYTHYTFDIHSPSQTPPRPYTSPQYPPCLPSPPFSIPLYCCHQQAHPLQQTIEIAPCFNTCVWVRLVCVYMCAIVHGHACVSGTPPAYRHHHYHLVRRHLAAAVLMFGPPTDGLFFYLLTHMLCPHTFTHAGTPCILHIPISTIPCDHSMVKNLDHVWSVVVHGQHMVQTHCEHTNGTCPQKCIPMYPLPHQTHIPSFSSCPFGMQIPSCITPHRHTCTHIHQLPLCLGQHHILHACNMDYHSQHGQHAGERHHWHQVLVSSVHVAHDGLCPTNTALACCTLLCAAPCEMALTKSTIG